MITHVYLLSFASYHHKLLISSIHLTLTSLRQLATCNANNSQVGSFTFSLSVFQIAAQLAFDVSFGKLLLHLYLFFVYSTCILMKRTSLHCQTFSCCVVVHIFSSFSPSENMASGTLLWPSAGVLLLFTISVIFAEDQQQQLTNNNNSNQVSSDYS